MIYVTVNTSISELLALDTAVNQTARQYNLPASTAAFRVFSGIRDYNKIGGLKISYLGYASRYLLLIDFVQIKIKL
jgi:hypothetical protein